MSPFQVETSFMTFEGVQLQGAVKIMEKLNVSIHMLIIMTYQLVRMQYKMNSTLEGYEFYIKFLTKLMWHQPLPKIKLL